MHAQEQQACFVCQQVVEFNALNLCMTCRQGVCDGCAKSVWACACSVKEFVASFDSLKEKPN